jgi:hypothetical protein
LVKRHGARTEVGKEIDHSKVVDFQIEIRDELRKYHKSRKDYWWEKEQQCPGRMEKDSIDILGRAPHKPKWIIEIDATRTDQVSQKLLSRLTLWGKKNPIQYVAILYPDSQNSGQSACEKYLRYGNEIVKKLNDKSSVTGIFVFPDTGVVELVDFKDHSHFKVEGKECGSMNEAAAEALTVFCTKHPVSYEELKKRWDKFVAKEKGKSRYKDIGLSTTDGVPIWSYSQFREHGECSYWNDFEKRCKKNGIKTARMRKYFVGGTKTPFIYSVD